MKKDLANKFHSPVCLLKIYKINRKTVVHLYSCSWFLPFDLRQWLTHTGFHLLKKWVNTFQSRDSFTCEFHFTDVFWKLTVFICFTCLDGTCYLYCSFEHWGSRLIPKFTNMYFKWTTYEHQFNGYIPWKIQF